MIRIRCTPYTFELLFGKEGKELADLLIAALEDYLNNLDYSNPGQTSDMIQNLAEALYELKLWPVKGHSPRCHIRLYVLHEMIEIARKYHEKTGKYKAKQLQMYLIDIERKMSDVKWGD